MTKTTAIAHNGEGGQLIIKIRLEERHGVRESIQEMSEWVLLTWSLKNDDRRRVTCFERVLKSMLDSRMHGLCRLESRRKTTTNDDVELALGLCSHFIHLIHTSHCSRSDGIRTRNRWVWKPVLSSS